MTSIIPVPTTRVSQTLISQQLLTQLNSSQTDLLQVEQSISTGQRISLPSQDAPAALRAISLQSLLERKGQIKTNLQVNQAYLSATDTALGAVSDGLNAARGAALSVDDSTSTDDQRSAAAAEIDSSLTQLVNTANQQFNGRYLFAGSTSGQQPFEVVGGYVRYNGNEKDLESFSNLSTLFQTNINGNQVFGALSAPPQSSTDLNPIVTRDTKLSDLNGGQGVTLGSIAISDGTNSSVVDLSNAQSIGDVIDTLEAHPPLGRTLTVTATSTGLNLKLDAAGGGNLTVNDVGSGTSARQLGILSQVGVGSGTVVGADLNPQVTLTTPLTDVLGARAGVTLASAGPNNDIAITAKDRGAAQNGLTVNFVDDGTVVAGHEQANYNAGANTLTVKIQTGASSANQVLAAINANPAFAASYSATLDPNEKNNDGTGVVQLSAGGVTAGGSGVEFDQTSGLQVTNGGQTYTIDLSAAKSVQDVINAINGSPASLLAAINPSGTGITIRSRLSGADFSIGENGGQTAAQLGIRTFTGSTQLTSLNHGVGVHDQTGVDFTIQRKDGTQLQYDISGAKTVQDVLNLINNDPNNQDPTKKVTAQLSSTGNGIQLVTSDTSTTAPLKVSKVNGSQAAEDLGLVPVGASASDPSTVSGGVESITGRDVNPQQVVGAFDSLIRLSTALRANNLPEVDRNITQLTADNNNVTFARAENGARQQGLDTVQTQLENEVTDLTGQLSNEIDTDLPTAITQLTQKQAAFQASLQVIAQMSQLTILNYL